MLEHLETYISSQKTIATYFMGFGILLLIMAIFFHLIHTNSIFQGLKIGLFVLGIVGFGSGYAYKMNETKLLVTKTELYKESPQKFHQEEKTRMDMVIKTFPIYQIGFIVGILVCFVLILYINKDFIKGVLFSIVLFFIGNMVVEQVSKSSLVRYHKELNNNAQLLNNYNTK